WSARSIASARCCEESALVGSEISTARCVPPLRSRPRSTPCWTSVQTLSAANAKIRMKRDLSDSNIGEVTAPTGEEEGKHWPAALGPAGRDRNSGTYRARSLIVNSRPGLATPPSAAPLKLFSEPADPPRSEEHTSELQSRE